MSVTRRIFVSMPVDENLSDDQNAVKWGIVDRITEEFQPEIFMTNIPETLRASKGAGDAGGLPWRADHVERVLRGCVGAMMLGFPRWTAVDPHGERRLVTESTHHKAGLLARTGVVPSLRPVDPHGDRLLVTEFTHYEAGVARTVGVPMFMALEEGVEWRAAFEKGDHLICVIPQGAQRDWLATPAFEHPFASWLGNVQQRRDVFLGYSSGKTGTAQNLKRYLEGKGATVLDWKEFDSGPSILAEIEAAAARCTGGVFLFTRDDPLEPLAGSEREAAPRDNVVFEAGYFVKDKGAKRVLIVRESGAKMPADLGGAIYAPLDDLADIEPISGQVDRFLAAL